MQKGRLMTKIISACFIVLFTLASCTGKQAPGNATEKAEARTAADSSAPKKTILFFGNSLTAGYGLEPAESFPSLLQHRIDSLGLKYTTVNAGVSGETSAGGKGRIDWILKSPVDVFVLELGANDGLRGIPVTETRKNLQAIIDKVKAAYPQAKLVLAGMQVPPNMGAQYSTDFRNMFPDLAKENTMALIPFLLEGVGGVRSLNQQDAIHPNVEGAKIVANNVWSVLEGELH
jgi:acyl-CoA thioesterase-1